MAASGPSGRSGTSGSRWRKRLGIGLAAVVLLGVIGAVGVPYVYIHFIKDPPPPPLSFEQRDAETAASAASETTAPTAPTAPTETTLGAGPATASSAAAADGVAGTWKVVQPSQAGYRVKEVLFGQDTEGVGRTNAVDGTVTIEQSGAEVTVKTAELGVDLTSVTSDDSRRDGQFQGRIMDTAAFPVALFVLDEPIVLGSLPVTGAAVDAKANGTLTLRGTEKKVTLDLEARRTEAGTIEVQGSCDVVFADFGIPNPSNMAATTQDHGLLEFLVTLQR